MLWERRSQEIIKTLKEKGRILRSDPYRHSYPFCWRSDTPLIYRAVPGTFVAVESIKERLVENNKQTYCASHGHAHSTPCLSMGT